MLDILGWAIVGLTIGALARLLVPGRQPLNVGMSMVLGVVGAIAGGAISWMIWGGAEQPYTDYTWPSYLFAILGSVLLLAFSLGATSQEEYER